MAASLSSDSDSDSSSSRSTSPEPDNKQKQTTNAAAETTKDDESSETSSGSDSSSGSGSESESSDEMDTAEDAPNGHSEAKKVSVPGPRLYKPPMGFKSGKKQPPPSSSTSSLFSDLRGKQVIHITAPSYLPLSKIKEVTMSKVMRGEPLLSYEGKNYGIPVEAFNEDDKAGKTLLVYDEKTQTYRQTVDHIPSYNVQEIVNVPGVDQAAVEALRDTVKPPRPQPKHLKMRFRPVGSLPAPPENLGSDSESDAELSSKVPGGEREERKRKHTDGDAAQMAGLPRKKSKKHSSQENGPEEDSHKKSKKSHKEEKKRKKTQKA